MSNHKTLQQSRSLTKQHSLSPDVNRDEAWLRKKKKRLSNLIRRSKTVTSDDLEELKGCFELGFGFGPSSSDLSQRLFDTIPALELYYAVHMQYSNHISRMSSFVSKPNSSNSSTTTIIEKGDDRKTMKEKLKQWAQMVGFWYANSLRNQIDTYRISSNDVRKNAD